MIFNYYKCDIKVAILCIIINYSPAHAQFLGSCPDLFSVNESNLVSLGGANKTDTQQGVVWGMNQVIGKDH